MSLNVRVFQIPSTLKSASRRERERDAFKLANNQGPKVGFLRFDVSFALIYC